MEETEEIGGKKNRNGERGKLIPLVKQDFIVPKL